MSKIVIAIDGYSACGKSSTAKKVAEILDYTYIDSGAMYRAVALYLKEHDIDLTNLKVVENALGHIEIGFELNVQTGRPNTLLNGVNVEENIRTMAVTEIVSEVSAIPAVRKAMVGQQRKLGRKKGVVMDGRDIGTVVFPDAELKVFMTADVDVRARRRQKEFMEKGHSVSLEEIKKNLEKRDALDATRKDSPLTRAPGAVVLDTSYLTFNEQVGRVVDLAKEKIKHSG